MEEEGFGRRGNVLRRGEHALLESEGRVLLTMDEVELKVYGEETLREQGWSPEEETMLVALEAEVPGCFTRWVEGPGG